MTAKNKGVIVGGAAFAVIIVTLFIFFRFSEPGQKSWETFFPTQADQGPKVDVTRITYNDANQSLVVYFSNRPRIDYYNFPKDEYLKFREAEDLSDYYRDHISGQYRPY